MSDPCRGPNACSGSQQANGTFIYQCPNFTPPNPAYYGLENNNLSLTFIEPGPSTFALAVNIAGQGFKRIAEFSTSLGRFQLVVPLDPQNFSVRIDASVNALIVESLNGPVVNDGVIWRVGSDVRFTSCLLLDPFCTTTLPLRSNQIYTFPCPSLPNATAVGLANYTVFITYNTATQVYTARIDLLSGSSERVSFVINNAGQFTIIGEPSTNSEFREVVTPTGMRISYRNVTWSFLASDTQLGITTIVSPSSDLSTGVPTEQPENIPPGCPTLIGHVVGTQDGKQICTSRFQVTFFGTGCPVCPCAEPKNFVSRRQDYVFYCTNLLPVLRGKGCNLVSRAQSLSRAGRVVTAEGLATYGMLRLMLTLLLFGEFDVQLLRQSFYRRFLKKLRASEFCLYASLFEGSEYWSYFLK